MFRGLGILWTDLRTGSLLYIHVCTYLRRLEYSHRSKCINICTYNICIYVYTGGRGNNVVLLGISFSCRCHLLACMLGCRLVCRLPTGLLQHLFYKLLESIVIVGLRFGLACLVRYLGLPINRHDNLCESCCVGFASDLLWYRSGISSAVLESLSRCIFSLGQFVNTKTKKPLHAIPMPLKCHSGRKKHLLRTKCPRPRTQQ